MPFSIFWTDTARTQFGIPAIDFRSERKLLLGKRRHLAGRKSEDWKASFSIWKDRSKPFRYGLHGGKRDRLGWYLGTEGEWRLSESLRTRAELTAYDKRGLFFSPALDWETSAVDGFRKGSIENGWIRDQEDDRGVDLRGVSIGETRNYLHAYTVNRFRERWRLAAQLEWDEDSEVFRDFRRDRFQDKQWNEHFGELAYESDNWTLSTLTRWQANNHEAMIEQHPTVRFDLAPTPWPHPKIYNTLSFEFEGYAQKMIREAW